MFCPLEGQVCIKRLNILPIKSDLQKIMQRAERDHYNKLFHENKVKYKLFHDK